jgi:hypothetical protein
LIVLHVVAAEGGNMFHLVTPDPGTEALSRAIRLFIVIAGFGALGAVLRLLSAVSEPSAEAAAMFVVVTVSSTLAFITARGIEAQRSWARSLAYVQGIWLLTSVPIGTIMGIAVLVYVRRASKAGLFGTSAQPAA